MTSSIPLRIASSTAYWIIGLSTIGSISFGDAFVAGKKRVPSPAAGNIAFLILRSKSILYPVPLEMGEAVCCPASVTCLTVLILRTVP
jgi:hypothetical protein